MLQNTTDISLVRIYRTENMTTDKSKMVVASIMQTLFKESFLKSFLRSSNPHIAHTVNGFDVGMLVRFNFTADAADRCG